MPDISVNLAGMKLENPTILASGILGQTGESILRVLEEGGAAAAVTKSIGSEAREGHEAPCLVETEDGLLNAMGLPNPGIDEYLEELSLARQAGRPVFASIFAASSDEFAALARKMASRKATAIELNLSCPHAEKVGLEVGADPDAVAEIVSEVKAGVKIPVFAKLSPMLPDIAGMAKVVEEAGGDGIVAINTVKAMKIQPEFGKPVLGNRHGGLSGPAVRPVGVRCVYDIASAVKIPVIGAGGIVNGSDALEYIMAGASAVQIGSGVHYRGIEVFRLVCDEISEFMSENGHDSIGQLVGIAHREG